MKQNRRGSRKLRAYPSETLTSSPFLPCPLTSSFKEAASLLCGAMVSVTLVRMSPDLELAKVYLSVFPFEKHTAVMESLEKNNWLVRKALGTRVKHQLRHVPELVFRVDDSLEYISTIDKLLKE